jgi:hypothetical protein
MNSNGQLVSQLRDRAKAADQYLFLVQRAVAQL